MLYAPRSCSLCRILWRARVVDGRHRQEEGCCLKLPFGVRFHSHSALLTFSMSIVNCKSWACDRGPRRNWDPQNDYCVCMTAEQHATLIIIISTTRGRFLQKGHISPASALPGLMNKKITPGTLITSKAVTGEYRFHQMSEPLEAQSIIQPYLTGTAPVVSSDPTGTSMNHARNPGFFACVCCFGILIRSVIVKIEFIRNRLRCTAFCMKQYGIRTARTSKLSTQAFLFDP
jgi:hypothetical protein